MRITYFSGKRAIVVNFVNDPVITDSVMEMFITHHRQRQSEQIIPRAVEFTFNSLTRELTVNMQDLDLNIIDYVLKSLEYFLIYKKSVRQLSDGLKKFVENWDK